MLRVHVHVLEDIMVYVEANWLCVHDVYEHWPRDVEIPVAVVYDYACVYVRKYVCIPVGLLECGGDPWLIGVFGCLWLFST